jgi:hypothetical protein
MFYESYRIGASPQLLVGFYKPEDRLCDHHCVLSGLCVSNATIQGPRVDLRSRISLKSGSSSVILGLPLRCLCASALNPASGRFSGQAGPGAVERLFQRLNGEPRSRVESIVGPNESWILRRTKKTAQLVTFGAQIVKILVDSKYLRNPSEALEGWGCKWLP